MLDLRRSDTQLKWLFEACFCADSLETGRHLACINARQYLYKRSVCYNSKRWAIY
jgi:hypothetical protein